MRLFRWAFLALVMFALPLHAADRDRIGIGRLITNDVFGDGINNDRWRTGSAVVSVVHGPEWTGTLPPRIGDLIEFRFRGEIITPESITRPRRGDRPYASTLSVGVHSHFETRGFEFGLGFDLAFTGPQTGLDTIQGAVHDLIGVRGPSDAVLAAQIPNGVHPTLTFEVARSVALGRNATFRPFIEVQGGIETLARIGGDFHIGQVAQSDLRLRDVTTGQRYRITRGGPPGWAWIFGADIAHVEHSVYLPASRGFTLTDRRQRVRAGVH